MRIQVHDLQASGHHGEYLVHLIAHGLESDLAVPVTFVVHPDLPGRMPRLIGAVRGHPRISVEPVDRGLVERLEGLDLRRRSREELAVARRFAERSGTTHCFFPYLNLFLYALGRSDGHAPGFDVSGILFSPGVRGGLDGSGPLEALAALPGRLRKLGLAFWLLRNPALKHVFVLNDRESVRTLNRLAPRRRPFRYLVDPVPPLPGDVHRVEGLRERYGIAPDRRVVLLLGSLTPRKGVVETIEAVASLPPGAAAGVALVLAGRVDPDFAPDVRASIAELERRRPEVQVVLDDRFLADEEVAGAFRDSDVIMAVYRGRQGASSGILGHAARHRTPVIVPRHDLIARLTREYGLGVVSEGDPAALSRTLAAVLEQPARHIDPAGMAAYVEERTPGRFASSIFEALLGGAPRHGRTPLPGASGAPPCPS